MVVVDLNYLPHQPKNEKIRKLIVSAHVVPYSTA